MTEQFVVKKIGRGNSTRVRLDLSVELFEQLVVDALQFRRTRMRDIQKEPSAHSLADRLNAAVHKQEQDKYYKMRQDAGALVGPKYTAIIDAQRIERLREGANEL